MSKFSDKAHKLVDEIDKEFGRIGKDLNKGKEKLEDKMLDKFVDKYGDKIKEKQDERNKKVKEAEYHEKDK